MHLKPIKEQLCCNYCRSNDFVSLNTYKHYAVVCNDCNNVSHFKKDKYLIEYLFPRRIAKRILPIKAFLRLYSEKDDIVPAEFYDTEAFDLMDKTEWRKSELDQVVDQLNLINFQPKGKKILDVSGGPGIVARHLKELGGEVCVTEYADSQVNAMKNNLGVNAIKFDYLSDKISKVVSDKFDMIMVRSSIIFCPYLNDFIDELCGLLNDDGVIFIESITPSIGEIFWWQQLEYKFPFIYSQETIKKCFLKNGFSLKYGYKDFGSYYGVKKRSYAELKKFLYVWLLEFPMVCLYRMINFYKRPAIDRSMNHKMITQFWTRDKSKNHTYINFYQGKENKSKTFCFKYNGYLKK